MSSHTATPASSRKARIVVSSLAVGALLGCHHGKADTVNPPAPLLVQDGYSEQPKERVGGAVQSVTDQELKNVKAARAEEFFVGRFPGVDVVRAPGGGFYVRIRGASSIVGRNAPLYVVDGMPVEVSPGRGLDWLNPADIARIDVLKNPAETSLYGVRGANGVIVITTKRHQ